MGRLLNNQESSPLERSKFSLEEFEEADKAKVNYDGWVEIESIVFTDKGRVLTYRRENGLEDSVYLDEIKRLR